MPMFVPLKRAFVSDIDEMLTEFDAKHPPSASQQAEVAKHDRIFALRDGTQPVDADEKLDLWEEF